MAFVTEKEELKPGLIIFAHEPPLAAVLRAALLACWMKGNMHAAGREI